MQPLVLATGTINTANTVALTVPAGQIWEIVSITVAQPAAGLAKIITVGFGTQATPANVKYNWTFSAAQQKDIFYPGWARLPAETLDFISSADANVAVYTVNGFKHVTA